VWFAFKRLFFGLALIALTSSVLLVSDWNRRQAGTRRIPHIAILQQASQPIVDEGVQGMIDGLAESGFTNGQSITIRRYNAEGDIATANAIAKEITSGQFDLVLTATTLSLQAVANANKAGKTLHVFGLVSDPFGAGVGIRRGNPLDHPRHLVGIGTMQPVAEAFRLAKKLFPNLQTVGEAWNPAEANSEAQTRIAREIAPQLGIKLLEANVDNSAGVFEAISSLVSRGAQTLWVGGDVAVSTALESVLTAARKGGIPVFTSLPGNAQRGALFDLGANYHEVGRATGTLAGKILHGTDPATLPVEETVPHRLLVNTQALKGLRDPWRLPDDVLREATGSSMRQASMRSQSQQHRSRWAVMFSKLASPISRLSREQSPVCKGYSMGCEIRDSWRARTLKSTKPMPKEKSPISPPFCKTSMVWVSTLSFL